MNYLALALVMPLMACSLGSNADDDGKGAPAQGSGGARTFQVADFSEIDLRGSDDMDVRVGTGFSIRAEGPSAELDQLRIDRDGNTLRVGRKNRGNFGWSKGKVKVYVTLPRLAGVGVSGSGNLTVDRVEGTKFEGGIAGSGNLAVGAMQVEEAEFSIAGSGNVTAAGTTKALEVSIAGSGDVDGKGLQAQGGKISIAGSGSVRAQVNGPAKIELMGAGDVDLGPNAHCTVSKMGSGTVTCGK